MSGFGLTLLFFYFLLMSVFFFLEFSSFFVFCRVASGSFIGSVFSGYSYYYRKCTVVMTVFLLMVGFYHFVGYSEDVWCLVGFSGLLVMVVMFSSVLFWFLSERYHWSGDSEVRFKVMSYYIFLGELYHHISTPLIMLLRVFMNFVIGHFGKVGLVSAMLSGSFVMCFFLSFIFFLYEMMVLCLQSFIFVTLVYELVGFVYPYFFVGEFLDKLKVFNKGV